MNLHRALKCSMLFGGMKWTGFGRESGVEGLDEYVQEKAVWTEMTGAARDSFVLG